jgi:hypothetical protein
MIKVLQRKIDVESEKYEKTKAKLTKVYLDSCTELWTIYQKKLEKIK